MSIYDILAMSLLTAIPILYTFPMILAHFFKIQGYKITDQTECNQLISKLNIRRSVFYQNGKPYGVFYGRWYIGYIYSNESQHNQGHTMYLIIKRAVYERVTDTAGAGDTSASSASSTSSSSSSATEKKIINIRERRGNPWWWDYADRKYDASKFLKKEPRDYQREIIDDIISIVNKKSSRSGTFFIYGEPGTGKSLLTLLLAKQIGAYYCDTWKPTDPGDNLSKVYSTIDDDKQLVLVLEECDKLILNVIQGNVKPHLYIPIPMMDKSDWNSMLDKVTDLGFYPNLILILTSNVSRETLHETDASVLRDGRIDKAYYMK
jgi:hypothetical protein